MSGAPSQTSPDILKMIFWPALITLAVTILRLVGELQNWSQTWFNREAGGGGAVIGIIWLVPIFGIYFAMKLIKSDAGPASAGRAVKFSFLSLLVLVAAFPLAGAISRPGSLAFLALINISAVIAALVMRPGWPALFKTLLAYGLAARIPVLIVMLLSMQGNWGTHYDAPPPDFPAMGWFAKWVVVGLVPQLLVWIGITIVMGSLFGSIAVAITHKRRPAAEAAAH